MNPTQAVFAIGRREGTSINLLGTGFAVGANRIATAYHVVRPNDTNLFMMAPKIHAMSDYQDTSDLSVNTIPLKLTAADPVRDLAVLSFDGQVPAPFPLVGTDQSDVGTPVLTLGFPHAPAGRMVLTQHQAHVGARILISNAGIKTKHIVLNTQAREGQSGGPVLDSSGLLVIAVLLGSYAPGGGGGISLGGVDPATLHQTTHAISAEYLRDML